MSTKTRNLHLQLQEKDIIEMATLFQKTPMAKEHKYRNIKSMFIIILVVVVIHFLTKKEIGDIKSSIIELLPLILFLIIFTFIIWKIGRLSFFTKIFMKLSFGKKYSSLLNTDQKITIGDSLDVVIGSGIESKISFNSLKYIAKNDKILCLFVDYRATYILPVRVFESKKDFEECANCISEKADLEINDKVYRN